MHDRDERKSGKKDCLKYLTCHVMLKMILPLCKYGPRGLYQKYFEWGHC